MNEGSDNRNQVQIRQIHELLNFLAHELRSPLSTLANDCAYLSAKYSGEDLSTSKSSIKALTEIISSIEAPHPSVPETKDYSLKDLAHSLAADYHDFTLIADDSNPMLRSVPQECSQHISTILNALTTCTIRGHCHNQKFIIEIQTQRDFQQSYNPFQTLQFPLKPNASPIKLALAEVFLSQAGFTISAGSDRLVITLAYGTSEDSRS